MLLLEILLAVAVRRSLDAVEVVCSLSLMELAQPPTGLDMTVARIKYWHSIWETLFAIALDMP